MPRKRTESAGLKESRRAMLAELQREEGGNPRLAEMEVDLYRRSRLRSRTAVAGFAADLAVMIVAWRVLHRLVRAGLGAPRDRQALAGLALQIVSSARAAGLGPEPKRRRVYRRHQAKRRPLTGHVDLTPWWSPARGELPPLGEG